MLTVIGQIVTAAGHVQQYDAAGDAIPYSMPANGYLRHQPKVIPLLFNHDHSWPLGLLCHLERSEAGGLMAVGRLMRDDLADLLEDGDWYFSDGTRCRPVGVMEFGHVQLTDVSLVRSTGNLCTPPIRWSRCDIAKDSGQPLDLPLHWRACWNRAHARMVSARYKRAADTLTIHDLDRLGVVDELLTDPAYARSLLARAKTKPKAAPTPAPKAAPTPVPKLAPAPGRVRLHGVLLDQQRSDELLDILDGF